MLTFKEALCLLAIVIAYGITGRMDYEDALLMEQVRQQVGADCIHPLEGDDNVSPTFRFPDLISACVSLVFLHDDAPARIFDFLGTQLVLRPPLTPRRRESMWRPQYELLLAVQRSPANRHPNPKFQLDQLTTACVALCQAHESDGSLVLRQARLNMAERAARERRARPG